MRVRLLGTAAGGGFPQWNCACGGCTAARAGRAKPRSQSSVAVSADGRRWFLLNASPDIRFQIEAFPPLGPPAGALRGSGIDSILLTNGDLDHTLGLFLLREGERLRVFAAQRTVRSLDEGLRLPTLLQHYAGADFHEPPRALESLTCRDGSESGLRFCAFPVPGKPPRYLEGLARPDPFDNLGYRFEDVLTGGTLVVLPDVAAFDAEVERQLAGADALLFDGTFWSEQELVALGGRPAGAMAHLPIGGSGGSLARLAALPISKRIYVHINNTNPILVEGSPERAAVLAAGLVVGEDGGELVV